MNKLWVLAFMAWCTDPTWGQDYLWPTDASRYMTSGFGEARPRRFHAAIDVKTWNQTGYKIFATRSGYIERMGISPFGYGRVLYLRLDTGEVAVYAHLERFNDKLQALAETEQERQGEFRMEKYFAAGALPVQQGELLGYTGQSGIGVPHLHFEMRDARNLPINPLLKRFEIVDKIRPTVKEIVVSPLSVGAMIDGDFLTKAFKPVAANGRLKIAEPIRVYGKVGFAVDAYDQADGANNQFNVYRYQLYVDSTLQFQLQCDRFSYADNKLIELMQDYFLQRRGWGTFDKLYREPGNTLAFYSQLNSEAGAVVIAASGQTHPAPQDSITDHDAGAGLSWGLHDFRVVAEDFFGNATVVEGTLLAGPPFYLNVQSFPSTSGKMALQIEPSEERNLALVETHEVAEKTWHHTAPLWRALPARPFSSPLAADSFVAGATDETTALGPANANAFESAAQNFVVTPNHSKLIRVQARDRHGILSFPYFIARDSSRVPRQESLIVVKDFYPHFLQLEVTSNFPMFTAPRVILSTHEREIFAELIPQEPNRYSGAVALSDLDADSVWLEVAAAGQDSTVRWREAFGNVGILPNRGGRFASNDGHMQVRFDAAGVYWPIYGRVHMLDQRITDTRVHGPIYRAEPQDAPLRSAARVELSYPDTVSNPQKLGICYRDRAKGSVQERWVFMKSEANPDKKTLSAEIYSLEDFAVIRDDEPPVLILQTPSPGATLSDRRPLIRFHVDDSTSGFESERAIQLRLDGVKLIAEYDPEREIIFSRPSIPLSPGRHELVAEAQDRCANVTKREVSFFVQ
ncbi:MAG: M23 family metallopeptidase [bacterium]